MLMELRDIKINTAKSQNLFGNVVYSAFGASNNNASQGSSQQHTRYKSNFA